VLRVHWTPDLAEAHIVEGLLRAHGLQAWAFDTAFVSQDWLKTLAFGGYRIMSTRADAAEARQIVEGWRAGELEHPASDVDQSVCPRCESAAGVENKSPRRRVFLSLIAADALLLLAFSLPQEMNALAVLLFTACAFFPLLLACPGVAARAIKRRYRCEACNETWRALPNGSFHSLAAAVDTADTASRQTARFA
jgi:hypothetical protein